MTARERPAWYAVRQFRSGTVTGSRPMTEDEAAREVRAWREHIGPAAKVPMTKASAHAVHVEDQAALWAMLLEHEPRVWVSAGSHRARDYLGRLARQYNLGELASFGVWPPGGGWARGDYYQVPARLDGELRRIKGLRILAGEPKGRMFRRLTWRETGGPERGNWPVPA